MSRKRRKGARLPRRDGCPAVVPRVTTMPITPTRRPSRNATNVTVWMLDESKIEEG